MGGGPLLHSRRSSRNSKLGPLGREESQGAHVYMVLFRSRIGRLWVRELQGAAGLGLFYNPKVCLIANRCKV
jgi:hypothetical protein